MKEKLSSKSFLYRLWFYMRRGWTVYIAFPLSALNFLVIQYRLLIEKVPLLQSIFPKFWIFAVISVPVLSIIAVLLGWWDLHRGTWKEEALTTALTSPAWRMLYDGLNDIKREIMKLKERENKNK